jgi:predicted ATPase
LNGDSEGGLRLIEESLTQIARPGWEERLHLAEVLRLKGVLTLEARGWRLEASSPSPQAPSLKPLASSGAEREAEECFLQAIAVAQEQHAKSWELRASTSLARLWQSQALEQGAGSKEQGAENSEQEARAKLHAAHRMLSKIYNWFTEGFDTKDLQEAQALLAELS